jgi:hypothetical protein
MNKKTKKDGIYVTVSEEERHMIQELQDIHAINISAAFRIFVKQLWEKERNKS